ncbi:MAG: hypothetical protein K2O14_01960, partial [Oscillospiraceae bacterium]|nr:hypothetical protein [Oscillospiraceae bacterium]
MRSGECGHIGSRSILHPQTAFVRDKIRCYWHAPYRSQAYITDSGYHNLAASLYVPVKFNGSIAVADSTFGDGSAKITAEGLPTDYAKTYSVDGLDATVSDDSISYKNALPGQYTLSVSDSKGVYAGFSATFTLTTDAMPASFDGEKLVKANGASDKDFENFMKNISSVNINGKDYAASGRGSV